MQCLRVLHTDAGIGLHGSGRCEGRGRRRDRELRVFVGGGGRGKGKESRRLGGIGSGMSRRLGVAAGLANGHHLREAKPLQPSRFLDGGQSSFRPGPRILHLGIAKLSPMIHFTCYICLRYICWPMGQRSQSMLDPYSIRLVVDCVLAFDGRLFHSSISNRSGRPVSAPATSMATALAEGKPSLLDSHPICQIAENAC
jgi:hypothetical protein